MIKKIMKFNTQQIQTDHDLLVELRVEMSNIRADIKDLKDNTTARIDALEKYKANQNELEEIQHKVNNEIELRVKKLEMSVSKYAITLALYSVAVGTMIGLIIFHILQ